MSEPTKVFGIEDYQHYFASAAISSEADNQTSSEINVPSDEATEMIPETESAVPQDADVYHANAQNISIGILIALGLLIGIQMGKIFLDKIWR